MKKLLFMSIMMLLSISYGHAQDKVVGEKGTNEIVGEKGLDGIIGEKRGAETEITKSNAQVELAYASYNQQLKELEKSLAVLHAKIEANIKLLEKYKRFKSPKQGFRLRVSWKDAMKNLEESKRKINVVKTSVVAPDMIR